MFGAAALLAAGCAEEIVDPESQPAGEPSSIVFTAGVETRTTLVPDNDPSDGTYHQIHWVNGDKINVDGVEFSTEDDGAKAYFTTKESFVEDNDYVAIYPATAGTVLSNVTIPAAQQAAEGDFHSAAAVSVAVSNTTTLDFKNVTSILKFQVPASAASVTISADEPLAGVVSVDYNNGEPTWKNVNAVNSVTVTGEFKPGVDYYVTVLPGVKNNFTVRIGGVVSRVATTVNAKRSMVMNMGVLPEPIGDGISFNGSVYEISSADGLAAALSNSNVNEVKIVEEIKYSGELWIKKDFTIDLNNHTIEGTSSKFIRVASETEENIEVVIKNGTILNNVSGGRCVETRSGNVSLELNEVLLSTPEKGANQPLTIGGSGENITVDIISSTIRTNHINGYAIITFNPVRMNIKDSEVSGWSALNIRAANNSLGSAGSSFKVTNSTLSGTNAVAEAATNNYTTIMIEDKNVTINVDSESTVKAVSTNSNYASLVGLGNASVSEETNAAITGTNVTIEGDIVFEGDHTWYLNVHQVNLTGNTIKFPESCKDGILAEGWSVSDSQDGLITVGKIERNLAFSAASATAVLGEDFTVPELSGITEGVTYTSSNTSVATVDASGNVTLVAAGETTITATAAETGAYLGGEASYTLTVNTLVTFEIEMIWDQVNLHLWIENGDKDITLTGSWPGTKLAKNSTTGKYEYVVPAQYAKSKIGYILSNNGANQTPDAYEQLNGIGATIVRNYDFYLDPSVWAKDGAWFAIYCWKTGGDAWAKMDKLEDNLYGVILPNGYALGCEMKFVRMSNTSTALSWDSKWNETDNLISPTDNNTKFTINDWSYGSWSTK